MCFVGIPITDPSYWQDEDKCNLDTMRYIFRSATEEEMPMIKERLDCLQEASQVLYEVGLFFPSPLWHST
jgi:hypothetical protein